MSGIWAPFEPARPGELHPRTIEFLRAFEARTRARYEAAEVLDVVEGRLGCPRGKVPSALHVAILIEAHLRGLECRVDVRQTFGQGVVVGRPVAIDPRAVCLCALDLRPNRPAWEDPLWNLRCPLPIPTKGPPR